MDFPVLTGTRDVYIEPEHLDRGTKTRADTYVCFMQFLSKARFSACNSAIEPLNAEYVPWTGFEIGVFLIQSALFARDLDILSIIILMTRK